MKRTCISLLAVTLTLAGACKKDSENKKESADPGGARPTAPADDQPSPVADVPSRGDNATIDYDFLASVPADSPFLLAMLRPMPSDFLSYLRAGIAPFTGMAQLGISAAKDEADPLGRAILDELDGKLSVEGMNSLGITVSPKVAMYAIGLSLAVRVELSDGQKFAAMLDRIEKKGGQALPRSKLGSVSYRHFEEDEGSLAIAVVGNQLVIGLMHVDAREHVLPVLLGIEKPAKSMADAGTVQGLVSKYRLMGMAVGFIDTVALTRLLTGQVSGRSKKILEASVKDMPQLSPVCHSEITQLAAAVPRMVFGYENASSRSYSSVLSLELRSDLAKDLATLQSSGVDFDKLSAGKPVVVMGAALSLDTGKDWLQKKMTEIAAKPFQCEHFSDANRDMAQAATEIQAPLPPAVAGGHGIFAVVTELAMAGGTPTGKGYGALGVGDPMALLEEMKKDTPPLANANIVKGEPATVPVGMPGVPSATVLADDRWLSVAIGDGMTSAMTSALASKSKASSPFLVVGYDYAELVKLSAQMDPGGNPFGARMATMMGKFLGYSTTSLYFTDDGILGRMKTVVE